jgi:dihydropteroate synthase
MEYIKFDLQRPVAMAIINITPDSFYAGSRVVTDEEICRKVSEAIEQGTVIIDLGGCSTRPGAGEVAPEEELSRLELGARTVREHFPEAVISIDTFRSSVARVIVERYGPCILNDIKGGEDPEMARLAAEYGLPLVVMHSEPFEGDTVGKIGRAHV